MTHEEAVAVASEAADVYIQRSIARGWPVKYNADGRAEVTGAALDALESVEPGVWTVATSDLDDSRGARIIVERRATGRPLAPALRRELAALLKRAADKADEWRDAAEREWAPHAAAYHEGPGDITPESEVAYAESRLARAFGSRIRDDAERLAGGK